MDLACNIVTIKPKPFPVGQKNVMSVNVLINLYKKENKEGIKKVDQLAISKQLNEKILAILILRTLCESRNSIAINRVNHLSHSKLDNEREIGEIILENLN